MEGEVSVEDMVGDIVDDMELEDMVAEVVEDMVEEDMTAIVEEVVAEMVAMRKEISDLIEVREGGKKKSFDSRLLIA